MDRLLSGVVPGDLTYSASDSHSRLQWASLPHPTQPGQIGGHEGVGKVVRLGPGCETSTVKVGDRVGIKWVSGTCGNCRKSSTSL